VGAGCGALTYRYLVPARVPVIVRLVENVRREGDCLVWTGTCRPDGYGVMSDRGRVRRVHVVAWEAENGPVPSGRCVLHRCDNPPCLDPRHLFLGTRRDNGEDRHAKGRTVLHPENLMPGYHGPTGERHHKAKLTDADVLEIRRLSGSMTQRALATRYGVAQSSIWAVVNGLTWSTGGG
jgi:hypothetical protein